MVKKSHVDVAIHGISRNHDYDALHPAWIKMRIFTFILFPLLAHSLTAEDQLLHSGNQIKWEFIDGKLYKNTVSSSDNIEEHLTLSGNQTDLDNTSADVHWELVNGKLIKTETNKPTAEKVKEIQSIDVPSPKHTWTKRERFKRVPYLNDHIDQESFKNPSLENPIKKPKFSP